jgi:two-component system NtrC family sensor kinase
VSHAAFDDHLPLPDRERLNAAIMQVVDDCIIAIDEESRVIEFNPAATVTFGWRREDVLGRPLNELIVPPVHRAAHQAGFQRYLRTGEKRMIGRRIETEALRADGSVIPVEVAIQEVPSSVGRLFAASLRDITARKAAEDERARQREALHQAEKLTAMGSLLANVAHELNNPLSILLGHAVMLGEEIEPGSEHAELVQRMHEAAERCAKIVRTFLDMARKKPTERREIQLNDLVRSALDLMTYGLRSRDIQIELDLDPRLPTVAADGDQLIQILVNLIVNAQQAMQEQAGPHRLRLATRAAGGGIVLEVADNGPGIPPDVQKKMFDPFFTTKAEGKGTGLGLSVCRAIVQAHEGTIAARNRPEGGALFRIELPVGGAEPAASAPTTAPAPPTAALIVDDEAPIAAMLARIVRRLGYEVETAPDGATALRRLAERGFDLIISDIRMPGLDGPGLWRRIAAEHPRLARRMLFVTGDTLSGPAASFLAESGVPCIEKPFHPAQVRAAIEALVAGG